MATQCRREALVDTDWVRARLDRMTAEDPAYRLLEVDMEPSVYDEWHLPGATKVDWETDLGGELGSDTVGKDGFGSLLSELGVAEDSTVILYGDKANWFAAHAYWLFTYYGHDDVRLMDGGRTKWEFDGYPTTRETVTFPETTYRAAEPREELRVRTDEVQAAIENGTEIVDVRNPQEYRGEAPPEDVPETTDVEGHIPTADNVPWGEAVDFDGTFKPDEELRAVYGDYLENDKTVAYCRIGERSSHTWFVLHELLGTDAANYDGSWTEWAADGSRPIEVGEEATERRVPDGRGD